MSAEVEAILQRILGKLESMSLLDSKPTVGQVSGVLTLLERSLKEQRKTNELLEELLEKMR